MCAMRSLLCSLVAAKQMMKQKLLNRRNEVYKSVYARGQGVVLARGMGRLPCGGLVAQS